MAATALLSVKTKYLAKFRVRSGNAHDIFTTLFRGRLRTNPESILVIHVEDNSNEMGDYEGVISSLNLLLVGITDTKPWGDSARTEWVLNGYVLDPRFDKKQHHAKGLEHAKFELVCNTCDGGGIIRILTHEQPAPLIEMIEWCQMITHLQKMSGQLTVEVRTEGSGITYRGVISGADFFNDRFVIHVLDFFALVTVNSSQLTWISVGGKELPCMIPRGPNAIKPLKYNDGRIVFSVFRCDGDEKSRVSCTVFPGPDITW